MAQVFSSEDKRSEIIFETDGNFINMSFAGNRRYQKCIFFTKLNLPIFFKTIEIFLREKIAFDIQRQSIEISNLFARKISRVNREFQVYCKQRVSTKKMWPKLLPKAVVVMNKCSIAVTFRYVILISFIPFLIILYWVWFQNESFWF